MLEMSIFCSKKMFVKDGFIMVHLGLRFADFVQFPCFFKTLVHQAISEFAQKLAQL